MYFIFHLIGILHIWKNGPNTVILWCFTDLKLTIHMLKILVGWMLKTRWVCGVCVSLFWLCIIFGEYAVIIGVCCDKNVLDETHIVWYECVEFGWFWHGCCKSLFRHNIYYYILNKLIWMDLIVMVFVDDNGDIYWNPCDV